MSKAARGDARETAGMRSLGGNPLSKEALDARGRALNPNNEAWRAMLDNRSRQLNPADEAWRSSRGDRRRR